MTQVTDAVVLRPVEPAYGVDQWLEFVGRLHPVVLHVPIGMLVALLLLEAWTLVSRNAIPARRMLSVVFAVSAVAAAVTGWLLGSGGEYRGDLFQAHRGYGIAAAVVAMFAAAIELFGRGGTAALIRRVTLLLCATLVALAGHQGGLMTHGRGHLADAAPPWLAPYLTEERERAPIAAPPLEPEVESEPEPDEPPSDVAIVVAAFRERCFECHDENKTKGSLRLDVVEGWSDGVDLESPEDSELLYRVVLPADDFEAMPPKGDRLDPSAIDALRRWIESGAPTEELVRELEGAHASQRNAAADLDSVRERTGARIVAVRGDREPRIAESRLDVDWRHAEAAPSTLGVASLAPIADRIVALGLARDDVGDDVLDALPGLVNLERVHLEGSRVTDRGIDALVARAPRLSYVN
ncbi:MAG: c-type cytochrome domain-containing protein, partial [Planctomycetota bacterium]